MDGFGSGSYPETGNCTWGLIIGVVAFVVIRPFVGDGSESYQETENPSLWFFSLSLLKIVTPETGSFFVVVVVLCCCHCGNLLQSHHFPMSELLLCSSVSISNNCCPRVTVSILISASCCSIECLNSNVTGNSWGSTAATWLLGEPST